MAEAIRGAVMELTDLAVQVPLEEVQEVQEVLGLLVIGTRAQMEVHRQVVQAPE